MHPRFHVLAAISCAWAAGLLFLLGAACVHGGLPRPHDAIADELLMLGLVLVFFTCATLIVGAAVGLPVVRLLAAFRLGHLYHFVLAATVVGVMLGLLGAVFFLVCVSEPGPRSFMSELSFTLPWALLMSSAGFLSYWRFTRDVTSKA
jgi:hypothetical protein